MPKSTMAKIENWRLFQSLHVFFKWLKFANERGKIIFEGFHDPVQT